VARRALFLEPDVVLVSIAVERELGRHGSSIPRSLSWRSHGI
jgi:hypothetical protein